MKKPLFIWIIFLLLLNSCEDNTIIQNAGACAQGIEPFFVNKTLTQASKFQEYNETIEIKISNAPNEEYFISEIKIDGDFPEGIEYDVYSNFSLTIKLSGIATVSGNFEFEIKATVLPYDNAEHGICKNEISHFFTIYIN